jgi:hypothetical protein
VVSGADAPWWTRATSSAEEQQFRTWFGPTAYSVIHQGCAVVALNSQLINGAIPEAQAQAEWLDAELRRLDALHLTHIILLTHMPLFVRSPDEQLDWSDWRNAYLVIAPPGRDRLLELIRKYRVTGYLCGHWHYPLERTIQWSEGHSTHFVVCDASGPASLMAQKQFALPAPAFRSSYCLHHLTSTGIETEFVVE